MSGIASSWQGGRVLRLNTVAEVNRRYAEEVGVTDTPTFLLFDSSGREVRRWVRQSPAREDLP